MIEPVIKEFAEKICKKRGYRTPYEIIVKPELPVDSKSRDRILIVKAGNPPIICISRIYVEACLLNKDKNANIPHLRDTIERALEFLPKMHHTLAMVPIAEAVALRHDSKRWARSVVPDLRTMLDDKFFTVEYAVTVTDTITNTSITRKGKDLKEITDNAKRDLSRMIIEDEEMNKYREEREELERVKQKEVNPNEISMSVTINTTETTMEY